jgi:hypothetical protein
VTLPFTADSPPRAVAPPDGPAVTIVLPLFDHRGLALQSVESWVLHQRAAPESFELIVILDDSVRAFEADLRARLRPWDQIVFASGNEMRQYHEAAVAARGRILFFTEPHCLAEPEAVGQVIHYFDTHDAAGMCGRTVPVMPNAVGRAESWMYDEGSRSWSQPDDWRKVILRAFGVRRDLYFDAGGFDHRYHRFAEWLLAARLHAKGHRLDYAPGVGVLHQYATSFGLLDAFNKEFTDGECLFRAEHTSPEFCERYFGSPPEWNEAIALDRPLLGLVTRALWQQARHRGGMTSTRHGAVTCANAVARARRTGGARRPRARVRAAAAAPPCKGTILFLAVQRDAPAAGIRRRLHGRDDALSRRVRGCARRRSGARAASSRPSHGDGRRRSHA